MINDHALSLKQAAKILGVSYTTMYHNRQALGFKLPNSRRWLIWASVLENFGKKKQNEEGFTQVFDTNKEDSLCQSISAQIPISGGLISQRQAAKELESLLKQRTAGKRKNSMTD